MVFSSFLLLFPYLFILSQFPYASLSKCWLCDGSWNITVLPFLPELSLKRDFGLRRPSLLETVLNRSQNSIQSIEVMGVLCFQPWHWLSSSSSPFWPASVVAGFLMKSSMHCREIHSLDRTACIWCLGQLLYQLDIWWLWGCVDAWILFFFIELTLE